MLTPFSSSGRKNFYSALKKVSNQTYSKIISFYVERGHESEWWVIQSMRRRLTVARVQINRPLNMYKAGTSYVQLGKIQKN